MVSLDKLGAWFLLMIISFVLVTLVHPPQTVVGAIDSEGVDDNVRAPIAD